MKDEVFGEITYDVVWETKKTIKLWNNEYEVLFLLHDYENNGIKSEQRESYLKYQNSEEFVAEKISNILCNYINNNLEYYYEINTCVKIVNNEEELSSIVKPISYSFMENGDIVIEFDFEYDQENGIGILIKYDDYETFEVGSVSDFL